ncbi:MAG TPA: DUF4199 domain-containing protein [Cryomorphaceae bacterium]|nr:DUF4199 domain-containing protein [Cryomorphaceae bacterium]
MNKNALNLGITMGVIGILIFLLMVVLEPGMILLSALGILGFAVAIILPIIFIRKEREANDGFITLGDAFKLSFVGLLIGGAIGIVFQILYIQLIDPEFGERMTAQTLEMTNNFMGGMDDDMREQMLREQEADSLERFTILGQLTSFGWSAIFYAVISLILAAILKRTPDGNAETLDA